MSKDKETDVVGKAPFLEFAPKLLLQFCGGLVALSLALVQIGFDDVVDAYAQSIIMGLENQYTECEDTTIYEHSTYKYEQMDTSFLEDRILLNETAIDKLEVLSHAGKQ